MSGDDDDVIIHRVQHNTTTDTATPVTGSRADMAALMSHINIPALPSQSQKDLANAIVALTA